MPDYFVPIDTTLYTDYHRKLVGKGVIIKFTMKFIEDHRKELADKYKKFDSFNEKFVIDDDMLATLREMGEKEGVKFNEEQYQKALPLINALFSEVNPIPVKTAMNLMGMNVGPLRMPVCKMEEDTKAALAKEIEKFGLKLAK